MNTLDLIVFGGLVLIAAGVALIYLPAGVIVAGIETVLVGVGARVAADDR